MSKSLIGHHPLPPVKKQVEITSEHNQRTIGIGVKHKKLKVLCTSISFLYKMSHIIGSRDISKSLIGHHQSC